jgi:hypothetical protein
MADEQLKNFIDSIDLRKCAFCGEVMLLKGLILGIKGLTEKSPVTNKIDLENADSVIPVVCPRCGFVHLFSGKTIGIS